MKARAKESLKKGIVGFFGAVGYLVCSLQFLMVVVAYDSFVENLIADTTPKVNQATPAIYVATESGVSLPAIIIGAIVTVFMVVLSVYILIKMPSMIVRTSKKAVRQVAESATPMALKVQHKKDNKKNRKLMTPRIILVLKVVLVVLPLILVYFSQYIENQSVDFSVTMYASLWLAGFSVISFGIQYLLARVIDIKRADIW